MKIALKLVFVSIALLILSIPLAAQGGVIEVPFEYYKNEVVVELRIDGKGPFMMLLDTGTDPSAIDLATADAIGIGRSKKGQQGDGGGTDKNLAYECKLKNVELGGLKAETIDAAAIDLSKISERMGKHIDGVIGHSLLNKRIVQFDYPHGVVRFFDRAPSAGPGAAVLKFRYANNVLVDDIWINGTKAVANIDTGSSGVFDISPRAVKRLGLEDNYGNGKVITSVGYNGAFENRVGTLSVIKVGPLETRDAEVRYFGPGTGHDKSVWDVNVGNQFLKNYVVTLDYLKKTITFEKP